MCDFGFLTDDSNTSATRDDVSDRGASDYRELAYEFTSKAREGVGDVDAPLYVLDALETLADRIVDVDDDILTFRFGVAMLGIVFGTPESGRKFAELDTEVTAVLGLQTTAMDDARETAFAAASAAL